MVWAVISRGGGRGRHVLVDWTLLARIVFCSCDPPGQSLGISSFVSPIMCAALAVSRPQTMTYQLSKLCGAIPVPVLGSSGHSNRAKELFQHSGDTLRGHRLNDFTVRRHHHTHRGRRGFWRVNHLRLFMAVWLSIFRRSHLVRRA